MPRTPSHVHRLAAGIALIAAASFASAGCGRSRSREVSTPPAESTAVASPDSAQAGTVRADTVAIRFARVPVRDAPTLLRLIDSLGVANWFEVLKLNRLDAAHVRDRDSLVVPLAFGDTLTFSPFPRRIAAVADTAKLLLVSLRLQAYAAYDSGRLVRWGPTSSGRHEMPTPTGLYHVNWKAKQRISSISDEWLLKWCINIHNSQGVSLHEYELPGRPASHSCVRLLEADAIWMYSWAEQWRLGPDPQHILREGTPIVVWGEWAWGQRAPWKRVPEEPSVGTLRADELDEALGMLTSGTRPVFASAQPDSVR